MRRDLRASDADQASVDAFRIAITGVFPELATSTFRLLTTGWNSVAVGFDDRPILEFPRRRAAALAQAAEPPPRPPLPAGRPRASGRLLAQEGLAAQTRERER